jgi:hypothetical protein
VLGLSFVAALDVEPVEDVAEEPSGQVVVDGELDAAAGCGRCDHLAHVQASAAG